MKHALWLTDGTITEPTQLIEAAVEAESAGWDGLFVSDSLPFAEFPDPWTLLAGIAARTDEIELGTWVVPFPRREPWQLATEIATLDRLAEGRLLVGAGLGNEEDYTAYGQAYEPSRLGDRFDETLEIVDRLWGGEPVSYDGEYFQLDDAEVGPTPVQEPRVPLLAGCWWPNKKPFHRGARWDGIMPWFASLTEAQSGPRGETPTGNPEEEVRDMLEYYTDIADAPGDIVLPTIPVDDEAAFRETCDSFGVTWLLSTDLGEDPGAVNQTIREGPPV